MSGEQQSGKKVVKQDSNEQVQAMTGEMEMQFKKLMEVTGATTPLEVLDRFITQKESTTRLNYLRTVTEAEKKHLEMQREVLAQQLESIKFSDVKETEEYGIRSNICNIKLTFENRSGTKNNSSN